MFKDKFKEEMQKIKVTDQRKSELLQKIETEQEKSRAAVVKPYAKKRWITAIAASLAIVIVAVSIFNLPIFNHYDVAPTGSSGVEEDIEFPTFEYTKGIPANVSYNQIYKLFSAIYKSEHKKYTEYTTGTYDDADDYVIEDEMVLENIEEDMSADGETGTLKGENTTAKPDSATDVNESTTEDSDEDFSTTNTQVENVDEADIIKTDGKYIYALNYRECKISIAKAEKGKLKKVAPYSLLRKLSQIQNIYTTRRCT